MSKKPSVLVRVQQNDATLKGVWLKFPVREDAVNFFKSLKKNTMCTSVKVVGPGIDDKSCATIASCLASNTTLTYVDMSECDLGSEGLREIAKGIKESKSLKTLRIGPLRRVCSPTDSGGEAILAACSDPHCSVNRLEFVRLAFNSVIGKHFWKYLPKTKIKTLLLEGDPIGEEGMHGLAHGLKAYNGLTSLYLHKFDASQALFFPQLMLTFQTANSPLQKLSLNGTPCKKETVQSIADIFNVNTSVQDLELSGCKLTAEAISPLLAVLNSNRTLRKLDLSENDIDQIRELSFTKATVLTDLNLSCNKLTEEILVVLTQQLPKNTTLMKLNISKNFFPVESAKNYLNPITMAACKIQELIFDISNAGGSPGVVTAPTARSSVTSGTTSPTDPELDMSSSSASGPPSPLMSLRSDRLSTVGRSISEISRAGSPRESFSASAATGSLLQPGARTSELIEKSAVRTVLSNPSTRAKCRAALCEEIVVEMQPVAMQMISELLAKRGITEITAGELLGDVTMQMRAALSN